jgi:hypothetical protein
MSQGDESTDEEEGMGTSREIRRNARAADIGTYMPYGAYIQRELDVQDKRKASFEQRGVAVITTSGTLVTLLFALAALSTKEADTFELPHGATVWLMIALGLFFGSAILAIATNVPLTYQSVQADELKARLREDPPRADDLAARDIAFTQLRELESAKALNSAKGWILVSAMALESLAAGCVAIAVALIL